MPIRARALLSFFSFAARVNHCFLVSGREGHGRTVFVALDENIKTTDKHTTNGEEFEQSQELPVGWSTSLGHARSISMRKCKVCQKGEVCVSIFMTELSISQLLFAPARIDPHISNLHQSVRTLTHQVSLLPPL